MVSHRIGLVLMILWVSVSIAQANFKIESGQIYDLDGFLVTKGSPAKPEYWLKSTRPGSVDDANPWEVRLRDGIYPRSLKSIYTEYTSEHRVIILGKGSTAGDLTLELMRPAFVPFVPVPESVKSASVRDGVLTIVALVNNRIPKEKLIIRIGVINPIPPQRAEFWVECPDPQVLAGPGGNVQRALTINLKVLPKLEPGASVSIMNGKAGKVTTTWGSAPR